MTLETSSIILYTMIDYERLWLIVSENNSFLK
jgi:hypothetical protein